MKVNYRSINNGVWVEKISERIDAEFYNPEHIQFEHLLKSIPHCEFKSLIAKRHRVLYMTTETYPPGQIRDGVKFLSPSDVINGQINWDTIPEVERKMIRLYPKGLAKPGDLAIEVKGDAKTIIVLPESTPKDCLISGSFQKIELRRPEDVFYLYAVFLSNVWLKQREHLRSNINIKFVAKNDLISILIPWPVKPIRKAIGNKICAAERLKELANRSYSDAIIKLNEKLPAFELKSLMPISSVGSETFSTFVESKELSSFMGAQFFAPLRRQAMEILKLCICPIISVSEKGERIRLKNGDWRIKHHIDPSKVSGGDGYWTQAENEGGTSIINAKPNNVLFLRMRPYLNKTTIVDIDLPVSTSSECFVYEFQNIEDSFYVTLCLRQPWALAQVVDIAKGDRPRVDAEFVDNIILPWPRSAERKAIGSLYCHFFSYRRRSDDLINKAIDDIEKMIQSSLDETRCIVEGLQLAEEFGLEKP